METYIIQVTKEELAILGQALGELPFKSVANIINSIARQVQKQEEEYAKYNASTSKANGGSDAQPGVREEGGSTTERG